MIEIQSLCKHFNGVHAVNDVSLSIRQGSITGLIGPNGAGKTTLFNTIAGYYRPDSGTIKLQGESIGGLKPHELFQKGVLRTFQLAHEFSSMSVLENFMMVPKNQLGESLLSTWFDRKKIQKEENKIREKAFDVIKFLKIEKLVNEAAGNLSGGQKKLLELGRTMMVDAKIVLLDEIGAGINHTLLSEIGDMILKINSDKNYTFCMIEHNIEFISRLCSSVVVMAEGSILTEGTASKVRENEQVIASYLGQSSKQKK